MKVYPKALRKATRDSLVGSIIGVISFCLSISLIYFFLYLTGYNYIFEVYKQIVVVATIVSVVGTTANAYRERKMKKKEQIQKVITENRSKWLAETRGIMADLHAAEKTFLSNPSDNKKLLKEIDAKVSQLILSLPYDESVFCEEVSCLANDVKAADEELDSKSVSRLLCRIRAQEKKCREILKNVWEDIKTEAQKEIED